MSLFVCPPCLFFSTTLVLRKSFTLQNGVPNNIQSHKHLLAMYFIKFVLLSATVAVVSSNIDKTKSGLRLSWMMQKTSTNPEKRCLVSASHGQFKNIRTHRWCITHLTYCRFDFIRFWQQLLRLGQGVTPQLPIDPPAATAELPLRLLYLRVTKFQLLDSTIQ